MNEELLTLLEPHLSPLLADWGFQRAQLKLSPKANAFMGVKRGGLGYVRGAAGRRTEFVYLQRGSDRLAVAGFAGWAPSAQIPAPRHAFDFPTPDGEEQTLQTFLFPIFAVWGSRGKRLNAERLEGDEWLLAPAGPIPQGGDDAALAAAIASQLRARLLSEQLAGSADPSPAIQALAKRMRDDLQDGLLPYLSGKGAAETGG